MHSDTIYFDSCDDYNSRPMTINLITGEIRASFTDWLQLSKLCEKYRWNWSDNNQLQKYINLNLEASAPPPPHTHILCKKNGMHLEMNKISTIMQVWVTFRPDWRIMFFFACELWSLLPLPSTQFKKNDATCLSCVYIFYRNLMCFFSYVLTKRLVVDFGY